jgi:hypothetical protein
MSNPLHFQGFIRGVEYQAQLTEPLQRFVFEAFDVNTAPSYGLIQFDENAAIAYSKWVSPKRTRSYPFARIYNTYNAPKLLTIIPVVKDEGQDGDFDKIQYSTISWMNLLNVYIVLGYYEDAAKNNSPRQKQRQKLTKQRFQNEFIKAQILEISKYRQSALHWNKNLFEERFIQIFETALTAYQMISAQTSVQVHDYASARRYLDTIVADFEQFKQISLRSSQQASLREVATTHLHEYLADGAKATFHIENYLGGVYYLTADEVMFQDGQWMIQESKHSTRKALPDLSDIQDGLFKLIVYSNLSELKLGSVQVPFSVRLKLTGKPILGSLMMPCDAIALNHFLAVNRGVFTKRQCEIIVDLNKEAQSNNNLEIEVNAGN